MTVLSCAPPTHRLALELKVGRDLYLLKTLPVSKPETIDSLIRKSGYNLTISDQLRASIAVTRRAVSARPNPHRP